MNEEYSDMIEKLSKLQKQARKHGLLVMSFDTEFMYDAGYKLSPESAVDLLELTVDGYSDLIINETIIYNL